MNILIIADEVWNDNVYGNNVLTNWFEGFDANFAEIYCGPGIPLNKCCTSYFQVTDTMMVKSLFTYNKAGIKFDLTFDQMRGGRGNDIEDKNERLYSFLKSLSGEPIRLIRDIIWRFGLYNKEKLKLFIHDFNPDVIFTTRLLTPKLLRLEKIISGYTDAPIVAFVADDEASLKFWNYSPLFWFRRILFNREFEKNIQMYSHYFMHSEMQAQIYREKYKLETNVLLKSGNFKDFEYKCINQPIRIVYAGRVYVNRWRVLEKIGKALQLLNHNEIKMILEIYTQDKLSKKQKAALNDGISIILKGGVKPDKLKEIYLESDIALHVESFDKKNRLITKYSFSTKIIDCLASSCAVMAIAPENQAGFKYLKDNDAAFCISDKSKIYDNLKNINNNPELIKVYAKKAFDHGIKHHNKTLIQKQLKDSFTKIIRDHK